MNFTTVSTEGLSRKEWLDLRKSGIGGSDAGAICGLNPFASAMTVYMDKISAGSEDTDNEAMRQGRDLEEYVALRFMEATGKKVRRSRKMYRSKNYPFMIADVDRLVVGEDAGLECKTASAFSADKWKDGKVPAHYLCQCYHYMAVTGRREWYIAAVVLGMGFYCTKILWDDEVIQGLIRMERKFWTDHVEAGKMPEPDGSEACDRMLNHLLLAGGAAEIPAAMAEPLALTGFEKCLERREEIGQELKRLEQEQRKIDQEIKMAMGTHERAVGGAYQISWKNVVSNRLDTKRLKEEQPDIYRNYTQESQTRKFTVQAA